MRTCLWLFPILLAGALPVPAVAAEPQAALRVVIMIGEDEYKTWETLPDFARTDLEPRGFSVTLVRADPGDKNNFPGLVPALREADLLVVSVRRRLLPKEQMEGLRAHLQAGKALVGLRTASHAFALRSGERTKTGEKGELMAWPEFDPEVLGGNYAGHHGVGPMTTVTAAPGAAAHPILKGVNLADLVGHGSLYKVNPLKASAQPLLMGSVPGQAPEPVAWTHRYGPRNARIFYTSLGHPDDFKSPEFRRLLLNGIAWAVE